MTEPADHVLENRRHWDATAEDWVASGERNWAADDPDWGMWSIPNDVVPLLPADLGGRRVIELGCGTGYVSAWARRRGASVYAIDNSERQLATARRLAAEHGLDDIEFVHGDAEHVPQPDASFDFAISEYGAAIWCDPVVWIPEAYRLLRDGGELNFLGNHPLAMACYRRDGSGIDRELHRPWFDQHRFDWTTPGTVDPGGIEFNLSTQGWFDLFADVGFEIVGYHELRAPAGLPADFARFGASAAWAHDFPAEQAWRLRKR